MPRWPNSKAAVLKLTRTVKLCRHQR